MTEPKKKNLPINALIFDMDGVLVDVANSYREAIIQTVSLFFTAGMGLPENGHAEPLLTKADVDLLKQAGGFNNDWDLTTAFVIYFLEMFPPLSVPTFPLRKHVPDMLAYLQIAGGGNLSISIEMLRQNKDIPRLARHVASAGGGLAGVSQALTHRNRHLVITGGGPLGGDLIQRIFQELYLGRTLFEQIYGEEAIVAQTPGFITNETLLISPEVLAELARSLSLGIATGRPKAEAEFTLKRLGIAAYFQSLVTYDDMMEAGAKGKPDPWSLLEAARRLRPTPARSAYIGDTVDDILAAKAANQMAPFMAIGSLAVATDKPAQKKRFEETGADIILAHPDRLKDIIFR